MSFSEFLKTWANDPKTTRNERCVRYKLQSSNAISECEILHRGVCVYDISNIVEDNVCWLRDQSNSLRWCYSTSDNLFYELTHKQLELLYGSRIQDRDFCAKNNERILPNGIRVPVVPP